MLNWPEDGPRPDVFMPPEDPNDVTFSTTTGFKETGSVTTAV